VSAFSVFKMPIDIPVIMYTVKNSSLDKNKTFSCSISGRNPSGKF
jgi:hypothetical protein